MAKRSLAQALLFSMMVVPRCKVRFPNKPMLVVSRPIYVFFSSFVSRLLCGVLILLSTCITRVRFLNISDGIVGRRANLCSHRIRVFNFVYVNCIMD